MTETVTELPPFELQPGDGSIEDISSQVSARLELENQHALKTTQVIEPEQPENDGGEPTLADQLKEVDPSEEAVPKENEPAPSKADDPEKPAEVPILDDDAIAISSFDELTQALELDPDKMRELTLKTIGEGDNAQEITLGDALDVASSKTEIEQRFAEMDTESYDLQQTYNERIDEVNKLNLGVPLAKQFIDEQVENFIKQLNDSGFAQQNGQEYVRAVDTFRALSTGFDNIINNTSSQYNEAVQKHQEAFIRQEAVALKRTYPGWDQKKADQYAGILESAGFDLPTALSNNLFDRRLVRLIMDLQTAKPVNNIQQSIDAKKVKETPPAMTLKPKTQTVAGKQKQNVTAKQESVQQALKKFQKSGDREDAAAYVKATMQ